jgi:uncharacterized protein (DUF1684 family)
MQPHAYQQIVDYRQRVFEIYARVRESRADPMESWLEFRTAQDSLFKTHPQSALTSQQIAVFRSLSYFPYDPKFRFILPIEPIKDQPTVTINLQDDGPTLLLPFGQISFTLAGADQYLTLYWIQAYAGGIFLPFKDATNGKETYSGGRYLLDTIKGADLGWEVDRLVIDFNFAYNPSCAYNTRWHCPLPPAANQLAVSIRAGEMNFT